MNQVHSFMKLCIQIRGLGGMFESNFADTYGKKILLLSMEDLVECFVRFGDVG